MKKRKVLVLFPLVGLLLTGCDVSQIKSWVGDNVYSPFREFVFGEKTEKEEVPSEDQTPGPDTPVDPQPETPEEAALSSVAFKSGPESVKVGAQLDPASIKLTATYSDGSTKEVSAEAVTLDTSVAGDAVTGLAEYQGKTAEFTIKVEEDEDIPPVNPQHAGTEEDPYNGYDAVIVAGKLASGQATEDSYYIKGKVINFEENFNPTYGNYSFKIEGGFIGWRLKNGPEFALFEEGDLQVGDTVTMYAQIQAYGNDCKPETKGGYIVSIDRPIVDVESVSLDRNELNMEVGMPDEALVATVLPANASNKAVTWASSDSEVATVTDGLVHAVAAGDAVITVRSAADTSKEASCTVHVTQPQKELTSIEVTTMPNVEYTEGDLLDLTGMVVTLHYNDNSSAEITSGWTTNIEADHELTTEDISLVVSFGGFSADPIALTITAKPQPVHAGTAEDPYTVSDAKIVFDDLAVGAITNEVYVTGTIAENPVPKINGGRGQFYLTDGSETDLYVYNINNIGGSNNLALADIPAGSVVVAKGGIKNYSGTFELCYNKENPAIACELISVVKPFIAPETVEITSGSELGVGSNMNLAATVGPEGAAQDVEWTIVTGGDFATLSDGVLTGVAAGDVTVRATAVGYENVYAEKTITVSSTGPAVKYATKVTSTSEIVSGAKYYIGYENEGNSFVFNGVDGASDYESVAVTENGIEQKESLICVEITEIEGGYSLKVVGSTNDGKYMRGTSSKNELKFESTEQLNTISISDGLATIVSNTSELVFNNTSGQTRFRYYKPATVSGNPSVYLRPCIYMLAE